MLFAKYVFITGAVGLFAGALVILSIDAYKIFTLQAAIPLRWRLAARLAVCGWLLLPALAIVVIPSGKAGVRVSQVSGTLGGTRYPGVHLAMPLMHEVKQFSIRDQLFTTGAFEPTKEAGL
jgi:hypothetical protein